MNKQTKLLILFVALAAIVYFLMVRKPWTSFNREKSDFAIEDTASITKIFLADTKNEQSLLERQPDGTWMVNGKFKADENKLNLLLQTMHDMKLRNPVSSAEHNTVIKELTVAGIKVEFYTAKGLLKTIYVGQITLDQSGTYMMIDGSSAPFITHIPGFVGYLTPRFNTRQIKWKSKLIFDSKPETIQRIEVQYPAAPQKTFAIDNTQITQPVVFDGIGKKVDADVNFTKFVVASFNQLYCEGFDDNFTQQQQDSIFNAPIYCTIKLLTKNNKQYSLQLHLKGLDKRTKARFDESGNPLDVDTEKYFGFANGDKNMVYIQQYNFGKVIRSLPDFILKK